MWEIFSISLLLGALSGVLAGLFGIGGGLVIVPILMMLFSMQAIIPIEQQMLFAIATSLATIVFTASSSVLAHHRQGNVLWSKVARLTPGIIIGAIIGAVIAHKISGDDLRFIFIAYLSYTALKMAFKTSSKATEIVKQKKSLDYIASGGIGFLSSILGIGGGSLTVPYLVACQVPIKNAVAISSACGLPIALAATLSYIFLGLQQPNLPEWSLGYIYLPAFFGIVLCSILTAPLGAKLATQLPAVKLKRYFSIMLFIMALKMIFA
ncbi:MAG: sulfite exporter TauE/SafE family protein [Methylococcales bacterium]|nr:sulfite exporter TauE/SafE family protein [Methylococcales bacterium]